jgi:hypothetical protein
MESNRNRSAHILGGYYRNIIIAVVAVLLLCCCCSLVVGWFAGDQILEVINSFM